MIDGIYWVSNDSDVMLTISNENKMNKILTKKSWKFKADDAKIPFPLNDGNLKNITDKSFDKIYSIVCRFSNNNDEIIVASDIIKVRFYKPQNLIACIKRVFNSSKTDITNGISRINLKTKHIFVVQTVSRMFFCSQIKFGAFIINRKPGNKGDDAFGIPGDLAAKVGTDFNSIKNFQLVLSNGETIDIPITD